MNSMQKVRKYINDNKIHGISGDIFEDYWIGKSFYEANINLDTF